MKKPLERVIPLSPALVALFAIALGLWVARAAGNGTIQGASMIIVYLAIPWLPLAAGLTVFAGIYTVEKLRTRISRMKLFVVTILAVVVCLVVLTPARRDSLFLSAMSAKVSDVIGLQTVRSYGESVKAEVDSGKLNRSRLTGADFTANWKSLFPQTPIDGHIVYGPGDLCHQVVVFWGGNFFRWGIEITLDNQEIKSPIAKRACFNLDPKIVCFVEK